MGFWKREYTSAVGMELTIWAEELPAGFTVAGLKDPVSPKASK